MFHSIIIINLNLLYFRNINNNVTILKILDMTLKIIISFSLLFLGSNLTASTLSLSGSIGQIAPQRGPISGTMTGTELTLGKDVWTNERENLSLVLKFSRTSVFGELEEYTSNLTSQQLTGIQIGGSYTSEEKPMLFGGRLYGDFLIGAGISDFEVQRFHNDNFSIQKSKRNSAVLSSATIAAIFSWTETFYLKPEIQVAYSSVNLSNANFSFEGEEYSETKLSLISQSEDDLILNNSKKLNTLKYSIGFGVGFDY